MTRATLDQTKSEHAAALAAKDRDAAIADAGAARRGEAAANRYAERTPACEPIILR